MADLNVRGRIVRKGAGMSSGLVWVECYLPFDPVAFAEFQDLAVKSGTAGAPDWAAAQAANPTLASKALDPIDAHGEAMVQEDVVALAHRYMLDSRRMDVMHDQVARKTAHVVESFVNTPEIASPHFASGAWCAVIKLEPGSDEWAAVESGELDAVSFQATVAKIPILVSLESSS